MGQRCESRDARTSPGAGESLRPVRAATNMRRPGYEIFENKEDGCEKGVLTP